MMTIQFGATNLAVEGLLLPFFSLVLFLLELGVGDGTSSSGYIEISILKNLLV